MKSQAQIQESIDRYQRGFWDRETLDRPPVSIAPERTWMPINCLREPFPRAEILPQDVNRQLVRTDYEDTSPSRAIQSDDWLPFSAPWRGVPWLEAVCGCTVRYSTGSLAPGHFVRSVDELANVPFPANNGWAEAMERLTVDLVETAPDDCFVSPSILRGASDALGALRGLTGFYLDLYDDPDAIAVAAQRINQVLIDLIDTHFSLVPPKYGGYGNIYGYWAPGKSIMIQEDAMGMCSPQTYENIFMPLTIQLVEHLGAYVLFHFHSTGYRHYEQVLRVPGLGGVEIVVESNGPTLEEMIPALRDMIEKTRLILYIDHYFEQLPVALKQLPHEGLYLMIPDKFIATEQEFQRFLAENW